MDQKTETVKSTLEQDNADENHKSEQDDVDADYKLEQDDTDAKCNLEQDDNNSKLNQDDVDSKNLVKRHLRYCGSDPGSPVLCGSMTSNFYSMEYGKRGKCLIFNHTEFDSKSCKPREGTDSDVLRLYCVFRELGFQVVKHQDLTVTEIKKELLKVSKDKDKTNSCFVCCFLTHGCEGEIYAKDDKYPIDSVLSYFRADECESLAGKPKIFIIQACQGDDIDYGKKIYFRESADCIDSEEEIFLSVKIPVFADLLIAYSVYPGFCSYRNGQNGSYYIQKLSEQLKQYSKDMDLVSILTSVNYKIAYEFQSKNEKESDKNKKKQMPFFCSSLTRNVKFY